MLGTCDQRNQVQCAMPSSSSSSNRFDDLFNEADAAFDSESRDISGSDGERVLPGGGGADSTPASGTDSYDDQVARVLVNDPRAGAPSAACYQAIGSTMMLTRITTILTILTIFTIFSMGMGSIFQL